MKQNWIDGFIAPLYYEEYERLVKVAYRKTKDWELAQDMVQDVFLLAIFNQEKLMHHPKPNAWLMLTLQNLIMNELRERSHTNIPLDEAIEVPAQELCEPLNSGGDSMLGNRTNAVNDSKRYETLQEALDAFGITEVCEPTRIPEEYSLNSVDALCLPDGTLWHLSAAYTNGTKFLHLDIESYQRG